MFFLFSIFTPGFPGKIKGPYYLQGPHGGTQEEEMNDTGKTWIELPPAVV